MPLPFPTKTPTVSPNKYPMTNPTASPTKSPIKGTAFPTSNPTAPSTENPTSASTVAPANSLADFSESPTAAPASSPATAAAVAAASSVATNSSSLLVTVPISITIALLLFIVSLVGCIVRSQLHKRASSSTLQRRSSSVSRPPSRLQQASPLPSPRDARQTHATIDALKRELRTLSPDSERFAALRAYLADVELRRDRDAIRAAPVVVGARRRLQQQGTARASSRRDSARLNSRRSVSAFNPVADSDRHELPQTFVASAADDDAPASFDSLVAAPFVARSRQSRQSRQSRSASTSSRSRASSRPASVALSPPVASSTHAARGPSTPPTLVDPSAFQRSPSTAASAATVAPRNHVSLLAYTLRLKRQLSRVVDLTVVDMDVAVDELLEKGTVRVRQRRRDATTSTTTATPTTTSDEPVYATLRLAPATHDASAYGVLPAHAQNYGETELYPQLVVFDGAYSETPLYPQLVVFDGAYGETPLYPPLPAVDDEEEEDAVVEAVAGEIERRYQTLPLKQLGKPIADLRKAVRVALRDGTLRTAIHIADAAAADDELRLLDAPLAARVSHWMLPPATVKRRKSRTIKRRRVPSTALRVEERVERAKAAGQYAAIPGVPDDLDAPEVPE